MNPEFLFIDFFFFKKRKVVMALWSQKIRNVRFGSFGPKFCESPNYGKKRTHEENPNSVRNHKSK